MSKRLGLIALLPLFLTAACGGGLNFERVDTTGDGSGEGSTGDTTGGTGGGMEEPEPDPCEGSPVFTTNQSASIVIGQPDPITSTTPASPTASNVREPYGSVSFIDDILYVPDSGHSRILGFSTLPTSSGADADFAIGQADLMSGNAATSATGLMYPNRIQKYDGKYYVLDSGNHRLLRYDSAPNAFGATASAVVVGNPDLNTASSGCSSTRLTFPDDFLIVGGKLFIVEGTNNRVLGWNTVPTTADTPADLVLGQPDLSTCDYAEPATATNLVYPLGIASDGDKLLVSDSDQYRILVWNSLPSTTGAVPDVVIGQTSLDGYSTHSGARSASTVRFPSAMAIHSGKLYVADTGNHRVLIWDSIPTSNFAAAATVIGQEDFATGTHGITASKLREPSGVFVCVDRLYVTQADGANRISVFEGL